MTGKIKVYNKRRGYGIIQAEKNDYFFRWNDIISDTHKECRSGEKVQFVPLIHARGLRAIEVQTV